jgi:hypothetical protein
MTTSSLMDIDVDDAGARYGAAAVIIWNDVSSEGREQFYAWHDKEHIPERLSIAGFLRGRRLARRGHSPEWLTIYEADDLDVLTSADYLARLNSPTPATERTLPHFRNTSRAVCKVVHSSGSSSGGYILAMRLSVDAARADDMCAYLTNEAFPRAMRSNGVLACHLYAADDRASYVNTAESGTRTFDVPSWVVLCEASFEAAAEDARRAIDGDGLRRLGVAVRDDAATYALEISRVAPSRR